MELFRRFMEFVRPYRWRLFQVLFLLLCGAGLTIWQPAIVAFILDDALGAGGIGSTGEPIEPSLPKLTHGILLLALCAAANAVFGYIQSWRLSIISQRVIFDIRRNLHKHLQKLSMSYFESNQSGRILSRVLYDVAELGNLASGTLVQLIKDSVILVLLIIQCFRMSWELTLIALIALPLYLANFLTMRKAIRRAYRRVREKFSDISGDLHEKIAAAKVVKSFTRERSESLQFVRELRENVGLNLASHRLSILLGTRGGLISRAGSLAVYFLGGYFIIQGMNGFTIGKLVQFNAYLGMLYGPAERLINSNDLITRALVALERIYEVLDTKPEVEDAPDAIELDEIQGLVEFRNVNFGYDPNELVLQNINLTVQPGEMCAFVGPSGSGKTTLANLIARFYDPTTGEMCLDGHDLRSVKLMCLRRNIGIVLQETRLFTGTIRDNLRYGKQHASNDEIVRAAMAANAHDFIMELPEDYDTEIGERGVKLSGGQRQRIAIARAILRDPRLLILDEATSALDSTSEALIQSALDRLMDGRTSFVIAHRLSTIMKADKIVVLENGIIVDVGTHDELLERGGLYAKLYNMQFRKQEQDLDDDEDQVNEHPRRVTAVTAAVSKPDGGSAAKSAKATDGDQGEAAGPPTANS